MKFYLIWFILLQVALVIADEGEKEHESDIDTRILGGAPESTGLIRNVVRLRSLFEGREIFCTGVLIHPTSVLTAARCVRMRAQSATQVQGSIVFSKKSKTTIQTFSSNRIYIHEQYTSTAEDQDGEYKDYDIAIIKINPRERLIGAIPARLPHEKLNTKPEDYWNKGLLLAGFGTDNQDGNLNVQVAAVTGYSKCKDDEPKITERQICTANDNTVGLCQSDVLGQYDSGAPLFDISKGRQNILIGIGSSSSPQCNKDPSKYTFVPKFLSWIKDKLRQKESYNRSRN